MGSIRSRLAVLCLMMIIGSLALSGCMGVGVTWHPIPETGGVKGVVFAAVGTRSSINPNPLDLWIGAQDEEPPEGWIPWAGNRVIVDGSGLVATTQWDGSFELVGVPEGLHDLVFFEGSRERYRLRYYQSPNRVVDLRSSAPRRAWTVIVYMIGDNNLESDMIADINEMEEVGSSDQVNIIAYADPRGDWSQYLPVASSDPEPRYAGPRVYYIEKDATGDTSQIYSRIIGYPTSGSGLGEVDMTAPGSLREFVTWSTRMYPADHYALVIWDHGDGITVRDGSPRLLTPKAIGPDTNGGAYSGYLDASDIANELAGLGLDLIAFDACLMGGVEVAYELRDVADVIVASEELVPDEGFDYGSVVASLVNAPSTEPWAFARQMVDLYVNEFRGKDYDVNLHLTMSAVKTYALASLVSSFKELVSVVLHYLDPADPTTKSAVAEELVRSASKSTRFGYATDMSGYDYRFYDLEDFVANVSWDAYNGSIGVDTAVASDIAHGAQTVLTAFQSLWADGALYSADAAAKLTVGAGPSGLSIYIDSPATGSWQEHFGFNYSSCAFAAYTRWDEVLEALPTLP